MTNGSIGLLLCAVVGSAHPGPVAQTGHEPCPMHAAHAAHDHAGGVDARGDREMGFSHEKAAHHFRLTRDGGAIEVEALADGDRETVDRIREHLRYVARAFAEGDFAKPQAIHDRVPPAADEMRRLGGSIAYAFEETPRGGRVRIRTADPAALDAVHAFLRFQIEDHRTGDSTKVE